MDDKKTQLTIKDIAKMVGVSTATVSNALSGQRHVKEETKKKVFEIAEKYNYSPNIIARGLSKKKTGIIGIVLPDINNPFYSEVIQGIDEEAKKRGYLAVVVSTYYDDEVEIGQLKKLGSMFVDGYIFVGGSCGFKKVISSTWGLKNLVLINRYCGETSYPSVVINSDQAIRDAVNYLANKGHSLIGYLGWSAPNIVIPESKYSGYMGGLQQNGLKLDSNLVFLANQIIINQYSYGHDTVDSHIKNEGKPAFTALICQTDIMALGAMKAIQHNGLVIPDDVSIIGYGNISAARFANPAMSTVSLPKKGWVKLEPISCLIP
ncbi:MAG: LacI family DNA-binding transcriptional regulator [Actinomycetota bacterium]|nr:LacI family DNA-binding transcriptional regulator [Actinomycetota bacterium]